MSEWFQRLNYGCGIVDAVAAVTGEKRVGVKTMAVEREGLRIFQTLVFVVLGLPVAVMVASAVAPIVVEEVRKRIRSGASPP